MRHLITIVENSTYSPSELFVMGVNRLFRDDAIEVVVEPRSPDQVSIETIWNHGARGQGAATAALQDIIELADKHGVTLTLVPHFLKSDDDDGGDHLSNEQLVAWYGKHGFVATGEMDGDDPVMVRQPQKPLKRFMIPKLGMLLVKHLGAHEWENLKPSASLPWGDSFMGGSGYILTMPSGNRVFLDATVENDTIYLSQIAVVRQGDGLGTKVVNALHDIAKQNGWGITVYKVTNPEFWRRFPWLKEKGSNFELSRWGVNEDADINSPDYDGHSYDRNDPVVKKYVEGWCYALAIAHNRRFGWPIYCLGADDNDFAEYGTDTDFFHGMVMHPTGVVLDITGPHTPAEFVEKWGEPIFRMGDDKALLRHLNDFMRRQSIDDLSKASHVIDTYMKPRWPHLYK